MKNQKNQDFAAILLLMYNKLYIKMTALASPTTLQKIVFRNLVPIKRYCEKTRYVRIPILVSTIPALMEIVESSFWSQKKGVKKIKVVSKYEQWPQWLSRSKVNKTMFFWSFLLKISFLSNLMSMLRVLDGCAIKIHVDWYPTCIGETSLTAS